MRLLGATIPRYQNVPSDALRHSRRHDEHWPATVEQCGFQRGHPGILRFGAGPAENDQIEDAAAVANEGIVGSLILRPAVRKDGRLSLPLGFRHCMSFHEGFKLNLRLVGNIAFECAGDCQAAHGFDSHVGRERRANGKSLYVTVELARNQVGGLESRRHRIVIFDWNQNSLHFRPGVPLALTCTYLYSRPVYRYTNYVS